MVSKITMFEFHLDGSQFGPASIQTGTEPDPDEANADESGSKSPVVTFLQGTVVFFLLFFVLWVAFSRLFSDDEK